MLNIFKKKETIREGVPEKECPSQYPKEVQEIHQEFNCAADQLVLEANKIIAEASTKNVDKVTRLESLGFKQAVQVTELKPLMEKAVLSNEQLDLLAYYKREYPLNKFITEEQVMTICHKYSLVCGDISRFRGFVPEKNLKQIEDFLFKYEIMTKFVKDSALLTYGFAREFYTEKELKKMGWWDKNTSEYEAYKSNPELHCVHNKSRFKMEKQPLKICAPIKDMDIRGLELKDGYKLERHIPDPVVLQPVQGGYLIITAWGDEASDPLVVNEINN